MYEQFFGLKKRPFSATPNPDMFVSLDSTQEALDELLTCIVQARGIAVVTSPAGLGKTILCKRLAEVARSQIQTVYLSTATFATRLDLLQTILYEFGIEYEGLNDHEARLKIMDAAQAISNEGQRLLIILDEAHLLNLRLFDELRILSDYAPEGDSLIRLVLTGQFELEEKLAEPSLSALNQRIGCHVCLKLFTLSESMEFLSQRLSKCGAREVSDVLTEEAVEAICRASDGNPRCLCQLADQSLLLAFAEEQRPVKLETVLAAFEDLKELPLHWNDIRDSSNDSDECELKLDRRNDSALCRTEQFILPDQELGLEGSDFPSEFMHNEDGGSQNDQLGETQCFSDSDEVTIEFNVLEVGAGMPTLQENDSKDSHRTQADDRSSAGFDNDALIQEYSVQDKYAHLDALIDKHGNDLDYVADPDQFSHPVGFSPVEAETSAESPRDAEANILERSILSDIDDLGDEIWSVIEKSKRSRLNESAAFGETWLEMEIVQPANLDRHEAYPVHPAPALSPPQDGQESVAAVPSVASSREVKTPAQPESRRYSNLFSRLRERRRALRDSQS